MSGRQLRTLLARQTALVAMVPFAIIALGIGGWLYPVTKTDTELHQQQIAVAVASRVAGYLESSHAVLEGIANLNQQGERSLLELQHFIDAQVQSTNTLELLYLTTRDGKVRAVGLRTKNDLLRQDLIGLDLTRHPLYPRVVEGNGPVWSDSYLSVVGGGLSVAQARASGDLLIFAEFSLDRLTKYLADVAKFGSEEVYLLDRNGNVVADDSGRYTARQVSLRNLPLIQRSQKEKQPVSGTVSLRGEEMVGSCVPIPSIGWSVLVTKPVSLAYRALWGTLGVIGGSLLVALGLGTFLALRLAGKLAHRFELVAAHARRMADGHDPGPWPQTNIVEFQELTADVQRMAETIRRREEEQATLMRNIPGMVFRTVNEPHWPVTFVSDGCLALTGHPAKDFLAGVVHFGDLIHEADRAAVWDDVQEALQRHRPYSLQYRICTADGQLKWVVEHGQGFFAGDGQLLCLEGIISDITEQVQLEEQLRQSQKMDSIGQLAGGVAHDFNNMLTAIIGSTEIIRLELDPRHRLQGVAEIIIKAANKSADLIRKLLLFSRKAPRQFKLLDLHQLLRDTLLLLERSVDKRISINSSFMAGRALIKGDAGQLENIFLNLGLNARDAMPDGGVVRVATRTLAIDPELARQLGPEISPGEFLEVTFADSGTGMAPEVQARIFEPFFTTKQVGKGTGLGLSAVYGSMKEHGAAITIQSAPGAGSVFTLYFPLAAATIEPIAPPAPVQVPTGKRLLFVDDEELLREIGRAMLTELGFEVELAEDGQEALTAYGRRCPPFDLVMLDVVMPRVNGRDTFLALKELDPQVRVLFMSGHTREASVDDLMADPSVVGFVQKPYRVEQLRSALVKAFSQQGQQ